MENIGRREWGALDLARLPREPSGNSKYNKNTQPEGPPATRVLHRQAATVRQAQMRARTLAAPCTNIAANAILLIDFLLFSC